MTPPFAFVARRPDPAAPARWGRFATPHGDIETPGFVVSGGQGAVASLQADEVAALGGQVVVASTYHLALRPGLDLIAEFGGLHAFMGWPGPLITDSGAPHVVSRLFAPRPARGRLLGSLPEGDVTARRRPNATALSQARLVKIDDDGITYRSHIDGSTHRLTPESALATQERLGADIMIAPDEPTAPEHDEARTARAMSRTHAWAARALAARTRSDTALFGVVGGGTYRRLRQESAAHIGGLAFDGFVFGGSLGTTARDLQRVLAVAAPLLPEDRPRYLPGVGMPADLFRGIEAGIDLFDSALPLRLAGRGVLMTSDGLLTIRRTAYREDDGPPDPACCCPTCTTFSRAYLRHLFVAEEMLAATLAISHNLAFVLGLLARIRSALAGGSLAALKAEVLGRFGGRP